LQINVRRNNTTTIFDLSGDIDFANSREVRQSVLREIQEARAARVVINLSQVRYIDSSGVASLVEGLKASRDLGSRFILIGLSTAAREVLQLSRLLKVFEVYISEEEALVS
jgi:anti-sigma B factor antagonist